MGEIKITQSALKEKKEQLKNLNEKFKSKVGELVSAERNLNAMWDGDANTEFHKAFESDSKQMDNFYKAVQDYATKLEQIIEIYAKAEQANLQTASTRNYR